MRRRDLAAKPDGVLEPFTETHRAPLRAVLDCLPDGAAVSVRGDRFETIWNDLTTWGDITFVVHTRDGGFETKGSPPPPPRNFLV
ncbi:hypothetical protein I2H38_20605 [Microvirga sp. BT350]|uniref:Uncharacterized protein n=1 Tax=Microvirga alba TaxID=2791025 RepID=A0A931BV90_9HYPH|nr:hypothetical protein [Microvirga alba]